MRWSGLALGGALASSATPDWLPRAAFADSHSSDRDILVTLFLRGGADALSLCPPYLDLHYREARPTLALLPPDAGGPRSVLDLDGRFGFPRAFERLHELYDSSQLAVVHACGSVHPTRSHFDAMHLMETGETRPGIETGWLGRHLALETALRSTSSAPEEQALLRAVGIGFGLQRTLAGAPGALPLGEDPGAYRLEELPAGRLFGRAELEQIYSRTNPILRQPAADTFRTLDLLAQIDMASYSPAGQASYPDSDLGRALLSSAALIRSHSGVEAIAVDAGGWDTHDFQGTSDGVLDTLMRDLSDSLYAFWSDLDGAGEHNVTLVVMSEFGRNLSENGSRGTDHGHGGLMLVLGTAVAGGRVVTDWPGLAREQLWQEQDLAVTIDYRDVLSEILLERLGASDLSAIFADPSYQPTIRGVLA